MTCCDPCLKCLLFVSNLMFAIAGLSIVIVGSYFLSNTSFFAQVLPTESPNVKTPQIILITVGVIMFFIAALGFCGSIKEIRWQLLTYAVILVIIFIIKVSIGIYVFVHKADLEKGVLEDLNNEFEIMKKNPEAQEVFHNLEKEVKCCGVNGYEDYTSNLLVVPTSCCWDEKDCTVDPNLYWEHGCAQALTDFSFESGSILVLITLILSILEVLGAVFAVRLATTLD